MVITNWIPSHSRERAKVGRPGYCYGLHFTNLVQNPISRWRKTVAINRELKSPQLTRGILDEQLTLNIIAIAICKLHNISHEENKDRVSNVTALC